MASIATFLNNFFLSLLILLLHLGCFIFTTTATAKTRDNHHSPSSKKRKISPLSQPSSPSHPKFKTHKPFSTSWHFIKQLFSTKSCKNPTTAPSPQSTTTTAKTESDIGAVDTNLFFPLRNDIFPCTACGEIFQKPHLLETHQALKHAVSDLPGSDPGHNIVQIIFKSGWPESKPFPNITRVLKIHNSPKILARFEEYREAVKAKAARHGALTRRRDERCIADGNELMRFHCSTFLCDLGHNGDSSICSQQFCNVCGIIKSGFSSKLDGIATLSTSWRAHAAIPDDLEREFCFMNVKRAMLVCRVIAGRIGSDLDEAEKDDGSFDSVMARGESGVCTRLDEEELLVFNPRAVLPCFVIVYSVL
ncbi:hypothetical protein Fmac_014145 [Flemingia macrophylla]|uniref:C2H2-type domain-containing protein n=1 Tax=Flemingia macrophylla TaxID=520843 RepID=A0ABD1MB11_9FABA